MRYNDIDYREIEDEVTKYITSEEFLNCSEDDKFELYIVSVLKSARIVQKIPQEEVASAMMTKQPNISRFESMKYTGRTVRSIMAYADAIGIELRFDL
jgi:5'-deoxynucleotidase YfbR-like HD superfamily hydrolase